MNAAFFVNLGSVLPGLPPSPLYENRTTSFPLTHPRFFVHLAPELECTARVLRCLAKNCWAWHRAQWPPCLPPPPSPLYLVDTVQVQRLATEPQQQGQELEAEGGGSNECPGHRAGLLRLTPPSYPPLGGQGVKLSRKGALGWGFGGPLPDPPIAGMHM